jgi:hypothetical protein
VKHLDGGPRPEQISPVGLAHPRAQHQEQRTQALSL